MERASASLFASGLQGDCSGRSMRGAALRISAREGSYPGMAQEQTLRIRVFRPGAEPAEQTVRYTGEPLECKFQSTENR